MTADHIQQRLRRVPPENARCSPQHRITGTHSVFDHWRVPMQAVVLLFVIGASACSDDASAPQRGFAATLEQEITGESLGARGAIRRGRRGRRIRHWHRFPEPPHPLPDRADRDADRPGHGGRGLSGVDPVDDAESPPGVHRAFLWRFTEPSGSCRLCVSTTPAWPATAQCTTSSSFTASRRFDKGFHAPLLWNELPGAPRRSPNVVVPY